MMIYEATATATGWRRHTCEHCGEDYGYKITRECTTQFNDAGCGGNPRREVVEYAKTLATQAIQEDFELIPCVHCGTFQSEMVARMRWRATRWWLIATIITAPIALLVLAVVGLVTIDILMDDKPLAKPRLVADAWLVTGLCCFTALGFGLTWWYVRRTFDPYKRRSKEYWRDVALERGGLTCERINRILEKQQAERAEEKIIDAAIDPFTGQLDHGGKRNPFQDIPEALPVEDEEPAKPWEKQPRRKPQPNLRAKPSAPPPPQNDDNPFKFN